MTKEELRKQQSHGLIGALERYGYTHVKTLVFSNPISQLGSWDEIANRVWRTEEKPYRVHIGGTMPDLTWDPNVLAIYHELCQECKKVTAREIWEHARNFLLDMIPVLGKLDVHAVYDAGDPNRLPRLHVYL